MSDLKRDGVQRWAPSYLRRQGQMTRGQRRDYRELWPRYGLEYRHGEFLDLGLAPVRLEIGFGKGENLVARAAAEPGERFVGIEVHKPGIATALASIRDAGLENVRLVRGDARLVLEDYLEGRCLAGVEILFPDPWPKPGDEHRRLFQAGLEGGVEVCVEDDGLGAGGGLEEV